MHEDNHEMTRSLNYVRLLVSRCCASRSFTRAADGGSDEGHSLQGGRGWLSHVPHSGDCAREEWRFVGVCRGAQEWAGRSWRYRYRVEAKQRTKARLGGRCSSCKMSGPIRQRRFGLVIRRRWLICWIRSTRGAFGLASRAAISEMFVTSSDDNGEDLVGSSRDYARRRETRIGFGTRRGPCMEFSCSAGRTRGGSSFRATIGLATERS